MAEPLSLGLLGRVLLRHWILLVACTLVGAGAAFGASQLMTPVYTATATQLVKGLPGRDIAANYEASQYAVARAKSYPSFIDGASVLEGVRSDMGNRQSIVQLRDDLSAENPTDTPLLLISATGTTPEEARDKANSAARHMARFITQIETVAGKSPIGVETAVEATLPTDPTSPRVLLLTALGAVIGFVLGAVAALIHFLARTGRLEREPAPPAPGWSLADRTPPADGEVKADADAAPDSQRSKVGTDAGSGPGAAGDGPVRTVEAPTRS